MQLSLLYVLVNTRKITQICFFHQLHLSIFFQIYFLLFQFLFNINPKRHLTSSINLSSFQVSYQNKYFRLHYLYSNFPLLIIKQMHSNNCQLRNSQERGNGVYALRPFKKGDLVYTCQIQQFDVPNGSHPSQVDMDKWVLFSLIGRTVNHSCDPNCGVGYDGANWTFVAFRDINQGEQLTYDYAMSNYIIDNFPICLCKSPICRRQIKGYRTMPLQRKKEYKGFLAPYLEKLLKQEQQVV